MWTTISAIAVSHIVSNDNIETDQRCVQISQKTDMILLPEITKCLLFSFTLMHFTLSHFTFIVKKIQNPKRF